MQFITHYRHSSGKVYMRVTTLVRKFADPNNLIDMQHGFD